MSTNTIETYALQAALRSYKKIVECIDTELGVGASKKNPSLVSTLLRFQEEMIKSTTDLVVSGKLNLEDLSNSLK